jgi:glycosyltransferase involved in cell wall biosynthesis
MATSKSASTSRGSRAADGERLKVLFLTPMPPGKATIGAQRRIQGLLAYLSRRHDVTAVSLVPPGSDPETTRLGLLEHAAEAVVVPTAMFGKFGKRSTQLRSLVSADSFLRRIHTVSALQGTLDDLLGRRRFDVVNVEFPFFSHYRMRQAPAGEPPPRLVLDEHNVEYDLVRQMCGMKRGLARHVHNTVDWRKVRREEIAAWRDFDGVLFTSATDEDRARELVPAIRSQVVPNGVDVEYFRRRPEDPPPDGRTVLFFGTFNYYPNHDGALYFLREVWPLLAASHPQARLKLIGANPSAEMTAFAGPRVELAGLVPDIRRHVSEAAVAIVPLRIGGGTRLKVLESMALGKAIVSTRLGAEGIEATHDRELLLADDPAGFAQAVGRVLDDKGLASRLGASARALVEQRYSWETAGRGLEGFYRELLNDGRN